MIPTRPDSLGEQPVADLPIWVPDSAPDVDRGANDLLPIDSSRDKTTTAPCAPQPDDKTVALYTFEGTSATTIEDVGPGPARDPGQIHGNVTRVTSDTGCGNALYIPQTDGAYVEIPHSPSWLLKKGAVDLWVRFDKLEGTQPSRGLISRDASGTSNPNHLTIYRGCDDAIVVRYQLSGDIHHYQCSDPVADETWHHVAFNFGPIFQLYVDGQPANRTDAVMSYSNGSCVESTSNVCGNLTSDQGIDGNSNPWVIGGTSMTSAEGSATPVNSPLGGAIDSVRISNDNRSF